MTPERSVFYENAERFIIGNTAQSPPEGLVAHQHCAVLPILSERSAVWESGSDYGKTNQNKQTPSLCAFISQRKIERKTGYQTHRVQ